MRKNLTKNIARDTVRLHPTVYTVHRYCIVYAVYCMVHSVYCIVKIGFEVSTQRFCITATIVDLNQGCPIRGPPVGPLVKSARPSHHHRILPLHS